MRAPFTDLPTAIQWLFGLQKYGIKFGLSSTLNLLARLGLEHSRGEYLHIAGTNGKGSVAAMLSAVLTAAGFPAALFTSPHLVRLNERFRLGEKDIEDDRLLALINRVHEVIDEAEPPTFFEFVTAMALLYFLEEGARPIILETGMGGRLDATNIVSPLVTVITNIAMDHQEFLGHTLKEVAAEKAGIIKPGAPLITGARQRRVLEIFRRRCQECQVPMYVADRHFRVRGRPPGRFTYYGLQWEIHDLAVSLSGRHQYNNAALALAALEVLASRGFEIPEQAVRQGLLQVRWPGRLERLPQDSRILLDGAHNPAAAGILARTLKNLRKTGHIILVLGIMADKDMAGILSKLVPLAHTVLCTRPKYFRAAGPEDLAARVAALGVAAETSESIPAAIRRAQELAGPGDHIVITGSLYTVGEAKAYFEGVEGEPA
ncbi:MAG: folylpolyglutamate synthase/dihydrofolate synthase family protein [Desulfobaccales bacterium]